jgi:hypothetical protein
MRARKRRPNEKLPVDVVHHSAISAERVKLFSAASGRQLAAARISKGATAERDRSAVQEQVAFRNLIPQAKVVEQRPRAWLLTHHRRHSSCISA